MKKLLKVLTIFFLLLSTVSANAENSYLQKFKTGSFVKVMLQNEINTLSADAGDVVTFINLQDMYVYETNAIPKNTIFYGEIEDVKEPVRGRDGAFKIAINKMITPDKKVYKIKAHIYSINENYAGGRRTPSAYYHKTYNHSMGFKPMLQVVPLNINEQGRHTIMSPGTECFIVIEEDIILK